MSENSVTILVVDDDTFTGEMTGMILESAGYEVLLAESGLVALEMVAEHDDIRLVVSDMLMPFLDGIQLFDELRQQGYTRPFVLLTGEDAEPLRSAHPAMNAILTKDEHLQDVLPQLVIDLLGAAGNE